MRNIFDILELMINKSQATNLITLGLIALAYSLPSSQLSAMVKSMGFFAFSGAITNWLAVHMLFEKVPLLYGSGVIPNRFEDFKAGIKHLMISQFFNQENLERFLKAEENNVLKSMDTEPMLAAINTDKIYDDLVATVMNSQLGGALAMFGGQTALLPLKEPFAERLKVSIAEIASSPEFQNALQGSLDQSISHEDLHSKLETVIDQRLEELTPQMVKTIVQEMIHKHLGWLVVWGGVFGGLLGLLFALCV